tara:strand:+ start:2351 stop:2905 length:555 start_codon:yes stop_codon:yes gene_type:complete
MAERQVSDKPFQSRKILVPIKSSEPEEIQDTARLGLLNWLSISQTGTSNNGDTMKAFIPKNLHTSLMGESEVVVRNNPMLFPTQTTNAQNLEELKSYLIQEITDGIKAAYSTATTLLRVRFDLIWMQTVEGTQYETYYNLIETLSNNTVARIIVTHPETSLELLTDGLDIFFENNFEVNTAATE